MLNENTDFQSNQLYSFLLISFKYVYRKDTWSHFCVLLLEANISQVQWTDKNFDQSLWLVNLTLQWDAMDMGLFLNVNQQAVLSGFI